jgi:hypothetical protein
VAFHTGRNVYETVSIVSKPQQRAPSRLPLPQSVSDLQKLSRQEIITLYLNDCTALPSDLTHIQGAWNGALLNCNGLVCYCTHHMPILWGSFSLTLVYVYMFMNN